MSALPTVLIFTHAEYGQANVNLATAYELALARANVYIASFASLQTRIERLQELVARHALRTSGNPTGSVSFHECKGFPSLRQAIMKPRATVTLAPHPYGVAGALQAYRMLEAVAFPWSREEHLVAIESCKEIITTIKPDVVAVDYLFNIAQEACKLVGQKFVVMSPNSIKELALEEQPYFAAFWRYPASVSGFPFPLKWWQIPLNIYLNLRLAFIMKTSARFREFHALRRSLGFKRLLGDQADNRYRGITYICPALVETDYPFAVIPKEILLCGPIIKPFDPLEESDPALARWLDNGPTVVVNLGSHVVSDKKTAKEMTGAFRILLDYHDRKGANKTQVLWKARTSEDIQPVIDDNIGKEMEEGKVKVVPWIEVEPVSVLQHPNVICTVHHGGANSYYEGVWSGLPHIVLPTWFDTFDYATRAEFLNIGIFGNKTSAPGVQAEELGGALVRVTADTEEAATLRRSAKELKEVCRAKGNGRKLAAMAILREAGVVRSGV